MYCTSHQFSIALIFVCLCFRTNILFLFHTKIWSEYIFNNYNTLNQFDYAFEDTMETNKRKFINHLRLVILVSRANNITSYKLTYIIHLLLNTNRKNAMWPGLANPPSNTNNNKHINAATHTTLHTHDILYYIILRFVKIHTKIESSNQATEVVLYAIPPQFFDIHCFP